MSPTTFKPTLIKKSKPAQEAYERPTTKLVYSSEPEEENFTAMDCHIKVKEVQLVSPISKEEIHALWAIQTFAEKKQATQEAIDKINFMDLSNTKDRLLRCKTVQALDLLLTDLFIYVEERAKIENEKRLKKANPLNF